MPVRFVLYNRKGLIGLNIEIGAKIKNLRLSRGMTQEQLAEKCNISRTYMQKIETAACSCTLDTLMDIAEALNIPLKKLFEFRD